jgi:Mn2+/Fe2+ NRAMP family transporter
MESKQSRNPDNSNRELLRYAGLGTQILVALGLAVFFGIRADKWLKFSTPLLAWLLPLLVIAGIIFQIIKQTSKRKDDNAKK